MTLYGDRVYEWARGGAMTATQMRLQLVMACSAISMLPTPRLGVI